MTETEIHERKQIMNYNLTKPCADCPFRTDNGFYLPRARRAEIAESITDGQQTFACHKTTEFDDDTGEHVRSKNEEHCAGAMILLEHIGQPNQMMRIAERIGMYDHTKLDMTQPVARTVDEFVAL